MSKVCNEARDGKIKCSVCYSLRVRKILDGCSMVCHRRKSLSSRWVFFMQSERWMKGQRSPVVL